LWEAAVVKGKKAAQNVGVKLTKLLPTGFACYFVASGCLSNDEDDVQAREHIISD
jgi:hypothetical protein